MTQEAYLDLIQQTKAYIGKHYPVKKKQAAKASPKPTVLAPLPQTLKKIEKEAPLPALKPAPPPPIQTLPSISYKDVEDILTLIRIHCPLLKLVDPPAQTHALLLLYTEEEGKHPVLLNLVKALNKAHYQVQWLAVQQLQKSDLEKTPLLMGERAAFTKSALIKAEARKDDSGQVWIGNVKAKIIPPLHQLESNPELKRTFWQDLLKCLK